MRPPTIKGMKAAARRYEQFDKALGMRQVGAADYAAGLPVTHFNVRTRGSMQKRWYCIGWHEAAKAAQIS